MWELYRTLLALRRDTPALRNLDLGAVETHADDERRVLLVRRHKDANHVLVAFNFADEPQTMRLPFAGVAWQPLLANSAVIAGETITIQPSSFALFRST
jgi:pullulanase/glycogen debranching enzyme